MPLALVTRETASNKLRQKHFTKYDFFIGVPAMAMLSNYFLPF